VLLHSREAPPLTTLVVTNDFPPRIGGIETFVSQACRFLDEDVAVLTSTAPGSSGWDGAAGYPVVRLPGPLLPTPAVGRAAVDLMRRTAADRVLFGAAAPLALLAPTLRGAGARRIVALTHGHEAWWATLPGSRRMLRRIGDEVDVLTTISDYVAVRVAAALSPAGRAKLVRLPPPVDLDVFTPAADRGLADDRPGTSRIPTYVGKRDAEPPTGSHNPTYVGKSSARETGGRVIAVGRMVRRKGFGTLLQAWALLTEAEPDRPYELVLVGDGPERPSLLRRVERHQLPRVRFTGALDQTGVLTELQRAEVLAFPVRTRLGGLDPEGLGLAPLEAAACGLPVVVGRSGGAPETVDHGRTGYLIDPHDPYELAARLSDLLADPDLGRRLGTAGRDLVAERFGAVAARQVLRRALGLDTV